MKTLDDAVIELGGVLPSTVDEYSVIVGDAFVLYCVNSVQEDGSLWLSGNYYLGGDEISESHFLSVGSARQFQQRAKELGFVNGYRWGVKHKTNGKKPELADDVVVCVESLRFKIDELTPDKLSAWNWTFCTKFKITDQRYKPADTSYLYKPNSSIDNEAELSIAIADAMNAAVSCGQVEIAKRLQEINKDVLAEAYNRKAEAEKKRVVDADFKIASGGMTREMYSALYDAGYLRLPTNKD